MTKKLNQEELILVVLLITVPNTVLLLGGYNTPLYFLIISGFLPVLIVAKTVGVRKHKRMFFILIYLLAVWGCGAFLNEQKKGSKADASEIMGKWLYGHKDAPITFEITEDSVFVS